MGDAITVYYDDTLPIGIHHGSLAVEARRKVEAAIASGRLRALVCTASLDLGVDWGDVDLVVQMGAPKGSSRLLQRIGRANHRLDEPSKGMIVPGNRFEYLEARAALDAIDDGELDPEKFRPGALDVLAQHVMALACAAPFREEALLDEVRGAAPYAGLDAETFGRILAFIESGGYALRAYDRFKRLTRGEDGRWRVSHPRFVVQHRQNAGIIVDAPLLDVRFRGGRRLGTVEDYFAATLSVGDTFYFAGLTLEVERMTSTEITVRATTRSARIPTYVGTRLAMTTHLAERVRRFLADPDEWRRFPDDVRDWLEVQAYRSALPRPDQLLVETFPHEGRHHMVAYSFEGWNAHQSLGMLITRRMEASGLKPLGFVANDYALACYGLEPVADPGALLSPDLLEDEFVQWVQGSNLLRRAFRDVAVIGGLVERQHPGRRKTGRQVSFSTDLIYDVLRRYEPQHLLLRAAWDDARAHAARLLDRLPARARPQAVRHFEDPREQHRVWLVRESGLGATAHVPTLEFEDGVPVRRVERFRAYGSPAESFNDYARLIGGNPRYENARGAGGDVATFATALQEGGYATDPNYARKVVAVADEVRALTSTVARDASSENTLKFADLAPTNGASATHESVGDVDPARRGQSHRAERDGH